MRYCLKAPCPVCQRELEYIYQTEEIPYFSEILITTARCACGFHHTDTLILREGEPARWELRVTDPGDLNARVIRSSSGTLEIPELGIVVEPGPACEAFITTVEGVLQRIRDSLQRILTITKGEQREKGVEVQTRLEEASRGEIPFTLVLEDPCGNSAILSPKAERTPLNHPDKRE